MPRLKPVEEVVVEPWLLKYSQAAKLLNVGERHIATLAMNGQLTRVDLGGAVRVTRASVLKLAGLRSAAE